MKRALFLLCLSVFFNLHAEESKSSNLYLYAKVFPTTVINLKNISRNPAQLNLEATANTNYSFEEQKFYLTDSDNHKVDLKTHLLGQNSGIIRHENILGFVRDVNSKSQSVYFNIQAN